MATTVQIPDYSVVAEPYEALRANADNLNGPWDNEYNSKLVKIGDLLNASLGTQSQARVLIRDDNQGGNPPAQNVSRIHAGAADDGVRNGMEIGSDLILERSSNGWDSPVFSRALNEFSNTAAIAGAIQQTTDELNAAPVDVQDTIDRWLDPQGPTVIKPKIDSYQDANIAAGVDSAVNPSALNPDREVLSNGINRVSRRNLIATGTSVSKDFSIGGTGFDLVVTNAVVPNSVETLNLTIGLNNDQMNGVFGPQTFRVIFETTSFRVFDQILLTIYSTTGSLENVLTQQDIILEFYSRTSGGGSVNQYEGAFSFRFSDVTMKNFNNDPFQCHLGSVAGDQNGLNWYPQGR